MAEAKKAAKAASQESRVKSLDEKKLKKSSKKVSKEKAVSSKQKAVREGEVDKTKTEKPVETSNPDKAEEVIQDSPKAVTKAGKHSEKGLKEAEEKQDKIEHQKHRGDDEEAKANEKPKKPIKPTRSRLERRGKKYREAAKLIDTTKLYPLSEAIELAVKSSKTKFDSTMELHIRLNVDPKQADQNIRDNVVLPAGTGKTLRVAVLADEDDAKKALKAGADKAGSDDLLAEIAKEQLDFDVLIATPNMMVKLAKHARVLGPRGLMPNPKSGTVTKDVVRAIEQSKAGKIEYRVDSTGIVHVATGKVSFGAAKLQTNLDAILDSIKQNKPATIKGAFINSAYLTTTMGPSIKLQI